MISYSATHSIFPTFSIATKEKLKSSKHFREEEDELEDKLMKEDDEGEGSQSSVPDTTTTSSSSSGQPISVQTDESGKERADVV